MSKLNHNYNYRTICSALCFRTEIRVKRDFGLCFNLLLFFQELVTIQKFCRDRYCPDENTNTETIIHMYTTQETTMMQTHTQAHAINTESDIQNVEEKLFFFHNIFYAISLCSLFLLLSLSLCVISFFFGCYFSFLSFTSVSWM